MPETILILSEALDGEERSALLSFADGLCLQAVEQSATDLRAGVAAAQIQRFASNVARGALGR